MVLSHEARNDRDAPGLARLMLWLGTSATTGANIAYGPGYRLLGALTSAWPAWPSSARSRSPCSR